MAGTEKKQQLKEKIGKAAMQCFAKYGLEKTTLDDIGRAVGLNKASLYYYYKNKEDIFLDVALHEGKTFVEDLQQQTVKKKGVDKRLLFYVQERMNYYKQVLNMHKVGAETLTRILPTFFKLYEGVLQQEETFILSLLKEGIKQEEIKKTDTELLAKTLINLSDALKHHQEQQSVLKQLDAVDYSEAVTQMKFIVQLIFNGLKT